jgi:hypothetical protein
MTDRSLENRNQSTGETDSRSESWSNSTKAEHEAKKQTEHPSAEDRSTPVDGTEFADVEQKSGWSRRRFLRGMVAGVGIVAAACGRDDPTPTPTATPDGSLLTTPMPEQHLSYLPQIHGGAPATAEPRIEPTPTKAPPTATPIPPTPTPATTPFPPGPPSKLGIHVERNDPQLFTLLKTGSVTVVKTLELDANFAAQIKSASPRTKLVGRIHMEQAQLNSMDPIGTARDFVNQVLIYADDPARKAWFDAWEAYNEPVPANAEEMKRLADFEAERTRLLAERGIRSIIGNFGTGQPPMELWEHFLPALQTAKEHDGWLGLHEYSAPTIYYLSTRENQGRYPGVSPQDSGWLTLRYRNVYNQILRPAGLVLPLIMTEMGVDGLVQAGRPGPLDARGWQHFQAYWAEHGYGLWGPGAYVEQLVWYDRAMQQDDFVIGACIYGLGTSNEWISYDIGQSPLIGVLEQYLKVHKPV